MLEQSGIIAIRDRERRNGSKKRKTIICLIVLLLSPLSQPLKQTYDGQAR